MSEKEIFELQTVFKKEVLLIDYLEKRVLYAYFDKNERIVSPVFEDSL